MNTSFMPSHLRPYGRMYMDTIFASPICIGNTNYINHDDVIQKLDLDIISYDASLGYKAAFREYIVVTIKVEVRKKKKSVSNSNVMSKKSVYFFLFFRLKNMPQA